VSWWRAVSDGSEWLAVKLALVFGFVWTVWAFFVIPLVAPLFPAAVQAKVFYYGSGWVQLFALPLLTWIGNKTQALGDRQARAQAELLARNTELTEDTARVGALARDLLQQNTELTRHVLEGQVTADGIALAVTDSRASAERGRDIMLERIEGIVTGNAELARTIEHLAAQLAARMPPPPPDPGPWHSPHRD